MKHLHVTLALASASLVTATPAAEPCNTLAHELPALFHGPISPEYDGLVQARWSGTSVIRPACIITPASANDVSRTMRILTRHQCRFAVKGGGHNANPGANSIADGVSIDLRRMDSANLARDRSYVSLGAGLTWGRAYDMFNNSRVGFPGGVCEGVGVGGVSLGGGQSLFQAKKGWVVDNILEYQLVLASGNIVTASPHRRTDLFKALKGGNTNFGIVTRVKIAAFDFPGLWSGQVIASLDHGPSNRSSMLDSVSHAMVDFVADNNRDVDSEVQLAVSYLRNNSRQVASAAISNVADVANPPSLRRFSDLPNRVSFIGRHGKIADFTHDLSRFQPIGFRQVTAGVTITNDFDTLRHIWDASDEVYNSLPQKDKVDWIVVLFPQPVVQQSYSKKRGGNSLGLSNNKDDQIVVWLASRWSDPSLDGMMEQARRDFIKATVAVAKKNKKYSPFIYANYAAPDQDPLCGYGAESVAFLKRTANKYDPKGVFQKLMPGGFKISQAHCRG
ncbi:6-hydroxy-D-nicotine oxidase [Ophiocordyceps camponoti-floridani]|uniref:6-hydroxy-D-nicotine oxidase n=1 Tax=Ophiocordyceps camponoti-floridani TaxID=2030778 RepID=A0A8H4Q741_9HYPO|nr:6-hydroxy-D-nicotine oxidase [Ophiocordyceps camponoti-floridani]